MPRAHPTLSCRFFRLIPDTRVVQRSASPDFLPCCLTVTVVPAVRSRTSSLTAWQIETAGAAAVRSHLPCRVTATSSIAYAHYTLFEALPRQAARGFKRVEIGSFHSYCYHFNNGSPRPAELKAMLADHRLTPIALNWNAGIGPMNVLRLQSGSTVTKRRSTTRKLWASP